MDMGHGMDMVPWYTIYVWIYPHTVRTWWGLQTTPICLCELVFPQVATGEDIGGLVMTRSLEPRYGTVWLISQNGADTCTFMVHDIINLLLNMAAAPG